jgi:hypothetical protein
VGRPEDWSSKVAQFKLEALNILMAVFAQVPPT